MNSLLIEYGLRAALVTIILGDAVKQKVPFL